VLLVVNTATFCGYTYQYEGLERLQKKDSQRGLTVIGVPSQDFNQESADNKTVKTFCESTFGVESRWQELPTCAAQAQRHSMAGFASKGSGSQAGISTRC